MNIPIKVKELIRRKEVNKAIICHYGMKVLFTTNIPSPYRVNFFNELGKLCDLTVLFERENAKNRDSSWLKNAITNFKAQFIKGINISNDNAFSLKIIKYLRNQEYDIIVIGGHGTPTGILSIVFLRHKKIPFILNMDGGIINNDLRLKYKIKKYLISSATAWLSSGVQANKYIIHNGGKKERIYNYSFSSLQNRDILENPISMQEKKALRAEIGIKESKVIIAVGQFIYRKGFDVLLKAAQYLEKKIGIYIVGGKATDEYNALIKKYNLTNVHFIEFMSKQALKKYYLLSDLFVLPTREDIWGLVINEAMANGLPVITTDHCIAGIELIQNSENGYIVPVEDDTMMADKINKLLKNEQLLKKMSECSLQKIKKYTIENMAQEHIDAFRTYLSRKEG